MTLKQSKGKPEWQFMTVDSPSGLNLKSGMTGREEFFCPWLGYEDDPETVLSYPAPYNFCHHCRPIAPVNLVQQGEVCLTPKYTDCPVYTKKDLEHLPRALRGRRVHEGREKTGILWISLVLLVIVGVAVGFYFRDLNLPGEDLPASGIGLTKTAEPLIVIKIDMTPIPTADPTETPSPTETQIYISPLRKTPRALETPFGSSPQLVIHKVLEGEGYIRLAEQYGTTEAAIKAINYELPAPLRVDTILVIPYNTDDVFNLPQFSVKKINTEGLTIEAYAERMQLDARLLKQYNALPDGYVFTMGEFIIIPN